MCIPRIAVEDFFIMDGKPLVSFCVKCYNQERYIAAALDGAFAQTYRPLEIVVCDDCSTDGSAAVVERKIDEYRRAGGDIPVSFHRNAKNLGNMGNWLNIGTFLNGELAVKADGDDVSYPDRTQRIVEAWLAGSKKAKIIGHRALYLLSSGGLGGLTTVPSIDTPHGACEAYSRDLWTNFPPAPCAAEPSRYVMDDLAFANRAFALAGEDAYLRMDDVLTVYRQGVGETFASRYRASRLKINTTLHESNLWSMEELSERMGLPFLDAALRKCRGNAEAAALNMQLFGGASVNARLEAFKAITRRAGGMSLKRFKSNIANMLCVLPAWCDHLMLNPHTSLRLAMLRYRDDGGIKPPPYTTF